MNERGKALRRLIVVALTVPALTQAAAAQNRLQNSRFDTDIEGWSAASGAAIAHSPVDANGSAASGSIEVSTTVPASASRALQCFSVTAGEKFEVRTKVFIPSGQATAGLPGLRVLFWPLPNCGGSFGDTESVGFNSDKGSGVWRSVGGSVTVPPGFPSLEVGLQVQKDVAPLGVFKVLFDDVFFGTPCQPGSTALCLNDGRFEVRTSFLTPGGGEGEGRTIDITDDTGAFWFFNPSNTETLVKVHDACSFNGRYWVFAAGLTNVRVTLELTDFETGRTRTYTNPQGSHFLPIQDTDAFATCP